MRFITLILLFLLSVPASAAIYSQLSGRVTDTAGQPLPGAIIELPELHTGDVADTGGYYHITNLPSGRTLVTVRLLGFAPQSSYVSLRENTSLNVVLKETVIAQHEVVVTGTSLASGLRRSVVPVQSLSAAQMRENASTNIIDAISRVPGVQQIRTGPAVSKPVIRGLGYNRVVTVADGVRQEGQQWGDEHGIEVDDYHVGRVEVLKGPASLAYGSDAVAGVINILSPLPPPDGVITGRIASRYQTNNGEAALHASLAGNKNGLIWDAYYTGKRAHDYQNSADGFVYDTRYANNDYGLSLGLRRMWGFSQISFSSFNEMIGLPEGERDSTRGGFVKHINQDGQDVPLLVTPADGRNYDREIPSQKIRHQRLVWHSDYYLPQDARLSLTLGYQQNDRREYGDVLAPDQPGLWLRLRSLSADIQYHRPLAHDWVWISGLSGMSQHNQNLGTEFIVPDYQLNSLGGFSMLRREQGRWTLSAGLRLDYRSIQGMALYEDSAGMPAPEPGPGSFRRFGDFQEHYLAPSGSIGVSYASGKTSVLRFNLASGFRSPNIAELAANGVHEGALRYQYGNTALQPEHSFQADLGGSWHSSHVSLSADVFANYINHYIFFQKLLAQNGTDSIPTRENPEAYNAFNFTQTNALLRGGEVYAELHPHPIDWLHLEQTLSYVQGENLSGTDSTRWLPQMPAARWLSGLRVQRKSIGRHIANAYVKLEADYHFAQHEVFSAYGSELPAADYVLLNAGLGFDWQQKGKTLVTLTVSATNLGDVAYQDALSRLRYAERNEVSGRLGISGMGRNVSIGLSVPLEWR